MTFMDAFVLRPPRRAVATRLPHVVVGSAASIAVAATSFAAASAIVVVPVTALWLLAFAVSATWISHGALLLTLMASAVKAVTLALVIVVFATHSQIGPHHGLDWIPLGMLNAATGLWLLKVIRGQAR